MVPNGCGMRGITNNPLLTIFCYTAAMLKAWSWLVRRRRLIPCSISVTFSKQQLVQWCQLLPFLTVTQWFTGILADAALLSSRPISPSRIKLQRPNGLKFHATDSIFFFLPRKWRRQKSFSSRNLTRREGAINLRHLLWPSGTVWGCGARLCLN